MRGEMRGEVRSEARAETRDAAWSDALDRALADGFTAVLVSDAVARSALPALAEACGKRGLALWLAVAPDAEGLPYYAAHAVPLLDPWLVNSEDALDPRRPPHRARLGTIEPHGALLDKWRGEFEAVAAAGVAGIACRDPDRLPAAFWRSLLAGNAHGMQWLAWTPGLSVSAIRTLIDSGFDGVCSSLAWWDGKSAWLIDERQRQRGTMQLAFPSDPFGLDVNDHVPAGKDGAGDGAEDGNARRLRRQLRVAAIVGDALLVSASTRERDRSDEIRAVNRWLAGRDERGEAFMPTDAVQMLSGADAPLTAIVRADAPDLRAADRVVLVLVNPHAEDSASMRAGTLTSALGGFGDFREVFAAGESATTLDPCETLRLSPSEVRVIEGRRVASVASSDTRGKRSVETATRVPAQAAIAAPRIAIENVTPSVDGGRFPVKRTAGEAVRVEADILIDGHEKLAAVLRHRALDDRDWREVRMEAIGNDRFAASFPLLRIGRHEFAVEAWRDVFATYRNELDKKSAAGLDVTLEIEEGRLHVEHALERGGAKSIKRPHVVKRLTALSQSFTKTAIPTATSAATSAATMASQVASLLASQTLADMRASDPRAFATRTEVAFTIDAERSAASFASWYELFPRSQGNKSNASHSSSIDAASDAPLRHGTFDDVIDRLPAIRAMGFDVLYFTPVHPIGRQNRKGRNNSLTAGDDDPGSPYAIGSEDGGHDALHRELGSFEDFKRMRVAAIANGLELALDFAIQCSPDHPWLKDHPSWFAWRPDGSLRYAENPPKKYEDIVNVDFYGSDDDRSDAPSLWIALRDVILAWVEQGVRIFRVDNPHTKPLPFWEWMIGDVRARYPDTIFLSEAFTRPKVMYRLAKVGFSQSYSYFTWRHTKQEFIDYLTELTTTSPRDFFRPHFFVNTPDINPAFLQRSGRAGFLIRAALASTLSGLWGIYSGFELCEATPVPGKEEYHDSEKYQIRAWDWERPGNIIAEITALNRIRQQNPALHTHLNVRFHNAFDPDILYFSKSTEDRSNIVLVAINLDPHGPHEADFEVPLWDWGLPDDATVDVTDLSSDHRFRWQGKIQRVRLDPIINPYAIWRVTP